MLDKEIIKSTVEKIKSLNYGDTITHADFASMLNVGYRSNAYRDAVSRVQAQCLESGKMLENVYRIGYRVTHPDDYSDNALRQYKQGVRRISKGDKVLKYAPCEDMSPDGLRQYQGIKDRALLLSAHMSGALVELKLLQKNHPLQLQSRKG